MEKIIDERKGRGQEKRKEMKGKSEAGRGARGVGTPLSTQGRRKRRCLGRENDHFRERPRHLLCLEIFEFRMYRRLLRDILVSASLQKFIGQLTWWRACVRFLLLRQLIKLYRIWIYWIRDKSSWQVSSNSSLWMISQIYFFCHFMHQDWIYTNTKIFCV